MLIKELSEKYRDYIIERRRFYHSYPELTLEEKETTNSLVQDLEAMNIPVTRFKNGFYGCYGTITGGKPGKTIMLRADIDALSVNEQTGLPFSSKNQGKMHACGHDAHISMLLGAAKILNEIKEELEGTVRILFQPAEELAVGAKEIINQGVTNGVDAVYGIHIWSTIDSPKINMAYGERMASADLFTVEITGLGAHASAPQHGHDAILAVSNVIMGIQSAVSRKNDPINPLVVTVGVVDAGQRFNIIADKAMLDGTVRTFNRKIRMEVEEMIREVVENVPKAYGCQGKLEYKYVTGPVINEDKKLVDLANNAAVKLYGEDALVEMEKLTGSEDFSYYQEKIPGVYGFIGARSAEVPGSEKSNHHECFTVDEKALERGAAVAAQFAYDFLNEK
ncbi:amidohydrolase [Fusobacterium sp. PH5-44]|uniref:amidohydrolase n=1 Tax=unclassified Fusobacterium TaxID=2648384 RepID=UPI003D1FD02A